MTLLILLGIISSLPVAGTVFYLIVFYCMNIGTPILSYSEYKEVLHTVRSEEGIHLPFSYGYLLEYSWKGNSTLIIDKVERPYPIYIDGRYHIEPLFKNLSRDLDKKGTV